LKIDVKGKNDSDNIRQQDERELFKLLDSIKLFTSTSAISEESDSVEKFAENATIVHPNPKNTSKLNLGVFHYSLPIEG